jgi:spoIIIJ-associated protein
MEWVETTGKTLEEAKDAALDQLGVDEQDAEFEVLTEAKAGLFGRMRSEARVRARVRPTTPRPKDDRRRRDRKSPARAAGTADAGSTENGAEAPATESGGERPRRERAPRSGSRSRASGSRQATSRGDDMDEDVPLNEQGEIAKGFVVGLLDRLDLDGDVTVEPVDDDTIEVAVTGGELGMLIGPKGAALAALQDLTRTVVQRRTGARNGWIVVDVSGYRRKRREALEKFTRGVADEVRGSGTRQALEPMTAADRKIVHDTVNDIDGVTTTSEGEEPRRRVVLLPEG